MPRPYFATPGIRTVCPRRRTRELDPLPFPAGRSGSGWPGSGQRSAHTGSSFRGGVARRSGNWRNGGKREWSALYGRHQRQREQLAKDCRGVLGRFKLWRELGGGVREIGGAIRGRTEVLGRFRAELEDRLRWERVSLGKEHSEAVRGIESQGGRILPRGPERVGETGAGGGAVGRALTELLPSS